MAVQTALYTDLPVENRPSFFATPLAWAITDFAGRLIGDAREIAPHHAAMMVISDQCSLSTIRELSRSAARGTVSPLRFAGASPSIVAGLPALQHGIRGPTLALTMRPDHAPAAVLSLIKYWFGDSNIAAVIAVAHHETDHGGHRLTGFIARSAGEDVGQHVLQLCRRDA